MEKKGGKEGKGLGKTGDIWGTTSSKA